MKQVCKKLWGNGSPLHQEPGKLLKQQRIALLALLSLADRLRNRLEP
jgi:hypothetical protein